MRWDSADLGVIERRVRGHARTARLAAAIAATAVAVSLPASTVEAAWEPPKFDFGGFGGWVHYDESRSLNGNVYGGYAGYSFTPRLGIEVQVGYSPADNDRGFDQTFLFTHGDVVVRPVIHRLQPYVSGGVGNLRIDSKSPSELNHNQVSYDAGGGVKLWFTDNIGVRGDFRWHWTENRELEAIVPSGPDWFTDYKGHLGVAIGLGGGARDWDKDGVPDDIDACLGTPEGVAVDAAGCPLDSDRDGVPDYRDRCTDTPAGARVDAAGCPLDSDGDRVYDGIDLCPGTPLGARVDEQGCPIDSDGDGVYDGLDQCANTPLDVETDPTGCPVAKKIERKLVLHGVNFASASDELLPSSKTLLDQVIESLEAYPEVEVEIAGYADSSGSEAFNLQLTQRRAESVRRYLIAGGIESYRLVAKGYGEADPIASNDTPEGRAQNRRVELHRLD